ncbi:MAG: hypothetical protein COV37_14480 [Bdellovibrio sp. CG11_big_fil_rev_8_21_14_0_20_39_38]|nr:MAG: hypothetical protein COV37_14480 [Bdellovibrio sp. CG11_big_fil_rev_8_21_14_0_20_39_38]
MRLPFFFLISSLIFSVSASDLEDVAQSREWNLLLHYRSSKSEVDSGAFFLAPQGPVDPLAELKENIAAANDRRRVGFNKEEFECAFPARAQFLIDQRLIQKREVRCERLQKFEQQMGAMQIWMIFAASFPNNPASVFGHTFLRIKTHPEKMTPDLLDYGINFAANTPGTDGTLAYAWKGLMGGYKGYYSITPFYEKVLEYSEVESRDMWEFELPLSPMERKRFLLHLWELLNNSWFDYYFLDENCSYQLFWPINYARPSLKLIDSKAFFWTPAETVRKLFDQFNSFEKTKNRMSVKARFILQKENLESRDRESLNAIIANEKKIEDEESADVCNAYLAYLEWQKSKSGKLDQAQFDKALKARSLLPIKAPPEFETPLSNPLLAHDSRLVGLKVNKDWASVDLAPFSHHQLKRDGGFIPFSEFEFFKANIRYEYDQKKWSLNRFDYFHVSALNAVDSLDRALSWRVNIASDQRSHFVEGGAGYGFGFWNQQALAYSLLKAEVHFLNHGEKRWSPGPSLEVGLVQRFHRLKNRLKSELLYSEFIREWSSSIATGYSLNRNQVLSFEALHTYGLDKKSKSDSIVLGFEHSF